jgi:hypothetical protein
MAEPNYDTMTDEELLQAAHVAGVDNSAPKPPAGASVTPDEGLSTAGKIGLGVAGGAGALLAAKFPALRDSIAQLAERAKLEAPLWEKAGLRTAEDRPLMRNLAGDSGREALQQHTMEVSRTIAANEAGIPGAQLPHLSQDIIADARREPNSVYDRVAKALPVGPLNPEAQQAVMGAGLPSTGRMSAGSPQAQAQIEALRQQLLAPGKMFTGQEVVNEMRGLRQEGFTNVASEDVSNQQLGRAQLDMARAIEGHIGSSIPPGADVTPEQFWDARKTLAKNFTIQNALRGNDVDLQVLARVQRADPQLLDGGTKLLADFASTHPEVATLPSAAARYSPPSVSRDFADISLKNPSTWLRPALGSLARRALTGDPDVAVANANQMFPARDAYSFSPPPQPPAPKFGGYLPAPDTVNAGGGASTASNLEQLGLSPDVQAAGAQHPAAAKLAALREHLQGAPERPAEPVDFQEPQKWGDFSLTPQQPVAPALQNAATVPFENVLEQGGTQGKPIAGIQSGYRPAPQSPKGPNMRTPPGALETAPMGLPGPSDAQINFRNQQAADRLRKVAGDLSVEGPGGNIGDPIARLRAALERRERGYAAGGGVTPSFQDITRSLQELLTPGAPEQLADGGPVRNSSSPGSPGIGGAVGDAVAALRKYFIDNPRREIQAGREQIENQQIDNPQGADPAVHTDYAGGGRVELIEKIGQYLDQLAQERAARATAVGDRAPKVPLIQAPEGPQAPATAPPAGPGPNEISPLQPGFLTRRQAMADGGSVDDTQSSIRKLADAARRLDNPSGTDPNAEHRARVATNLASLVYGLDAQGQPAFGGRAWTSSQGGTPAGALDALTAAPHNLVQFAKTVDKYLPGKSNPQFWDSIDPSWSSAAAQRLGQLRQRLQQAGGVAPAQGIGDTIADIATDPSMIAPMGAAKLASEGTAARKLINWGSGGTEAPAQPVAQGAH